MNAWAVVDEHGEIVRWRAMSDGEQGFEIYLTRRAALGARFVGEAIAPIEIDRVGKIRDRKKGKP